MYIGSRVTYEKPLSGRFILKTSSLTKPNKKRKKNGSKKRKRAEPEQKTDTLAEPEPKTNTPTKRPRPEQGTGSSPESSLASEQLWLDAYTPRGWKPFLHKLKQYDYYNYKSLETMQKWLFRVLKHNSINMYRANGRTGRHHQSLNSGRIQHICFLSGPVGCGKTTSVRLLAKQFKLSIDDFNVDNEFKPPYAEKLAHKLNNSLKETKECWGGSRTSYTNQTHAKIVVFDDLAGSYLKKKEDEKKKGPSETDIFKGIEMHLDWVYKNSPSVVIPCVCIVNETGNSVLKRIMKKAFHVRMRPRHTNSVVDLGRQITSSRFDVSTLRTMAQMAHGDVRTFLNMLQFMTIGRNANSPPRRGQNCDQLHSKYFVPDIFMCVRIILGIVPLNISAEREKRLRQSACKSRARVNPKFLLHQDKIEQKSYFFKTYGFDNVQKLVHENFLCYAKPTIPIIIHDDKGNDKKSDLVLDTIADELEMYSNMDTSSRIIWKYERGRMSERDHEYDLTLGDIHVFNAAMFYTTHGRQIMNPRCDRYTNMSYTGKPIYHKFPRQSDIDEAQELLQDLEVELDGENDMCTFDTSHIYQHSIYELQYLQHITCRKIQQKGMMSKHASRIKYLK